MKNWNKLADKYEGLQIREDSLDTLVEFPIQRKLVGNVEGKRILDLACGSGRKALQLAHEGAAYVLGIDISESFISSWDHREKPAHLAFVQGDISRLRDVPELRDQQFDKVLLFQALTYSTNIPGTMADIRALLPPGGQLVLTTVHPFRFVVEKQDRLGAAPGDAYRDESFYSFPTIWDPTVTLSHATPMFSTVVNAIIKNGFSIDQVIEPDLSDAQKKKYSHKAQWMAKYFGIIAYDCHAV